MNPSETDKIERGVKLSEVLIGNYMYVLNEPVEEFTFSCVRGQSDIDITCVNEAATEYKFEWKE